MKVILTQSVPKVGAKDTVVNVADGYARNYLFPKGLAIFADKAQVDALGKRQERSAAKSADALAGAKSLAEKLHGQSIRIPGQVGPQGKLMGSITSANVVEAIRDQLGTSLDRKQLGHLDAIKRLGRYDVALDLHSGVHANVKLDVYDPNAPVVEETPEEPIAEESGPDFE